MSSNTIFRKRNHRIAITVMYFVGIALFVGLDQLTKLWAMHSLKKVGIMPVIGHYVQFNYSENTGAAFSILQGQHLLLTIVPFLLSVVGIVIIVSGLLKSALGDISMMLIASGGIGNLIDRVTRGYVVDFIDFNVIHFAIFNVADSCVTIGVILLIIYLLVKESDGRRKSRSEIFTRRRF